jgi:hypothetical protein
MTGKKDEPKGVLAIWNDLDPKIETEYHEWYWQEHLLERLGVPGFLTALRYEAIGTGPRFFTFYHTTSVEVLRSPAYLQKIQNPTEWTRRCMASFRNMCRTACRETLDLGRGIGSAAVTMEIKPAAGNEDSLRRWLSEEVFPGLLKSPGLHGMIRCHLWEGDLGVTTQKASEEDLRGSKDRLVDWVVMIEASSADQAEKGAQKMMAIPFAEKGARETPSPYAYRLLHYLHSPDGR